MSKKATYYARRGDETLEVSVVDTEGKTHVLKFDEGSYSTADPYLKFRLEAFAEDPDHPVTKRKPKALGGEEDSDDEQSDDENAVAELGEAAEPPGEVIEVPPTGETAELSSEEGSF